MHIGEVAAAAGTSASRIRYYERLGLLPAPERVAGRRRYDRAVLRRLAAIDAAQRGGLSLEGIRALLEPGAEPLSRRLPELAARRLAEVDAEIERAERSRAWLTLATACGCESAGECALLAGG